MVVRGVALTPLTVPSFFFASATALVPAILLVDGSALALAALVGVPAAVVVDNLDLEVVVDVAVDGTAGLRETGVVDSGFRTVLVLVLGRVEERRSLADDTVFGAGDLVAVAGAIEVRLALATDGFRESSAELVDGCDRWLEEEDVGAVALVGGLRTVLAASGRVGGLLRELPGGAVREEADEVGFVAEEVVVVPGLLAVVDVNGRFGGAAAEALAGASVVFPWGTGSAAVVMSVSFSVEVVVDSGACATDSGTV